MAISPTSATSSNFTPIPVQKRGNGWDADAQRVFIALLATAGSKRNAALAIGRTAHGIDQLLKRELLASIATDFYLRQITIIEVIFDLSSTSFGLDPREGLHGLRRACHGLIEIVDTPFASSFDQRRRSWWRQQGARVSAGVPHLFDISRASLAMPLLTLGASLFPHP